VFVGLRSVGAYPRHILSHQNVHGDDMRTPTPVHNFITIRLSLFRPLTICENAHRETRLVICFFRQPTAETYAHFYDQ